MFFKIKIINGYFSYILFSEEKDKSTIFHCIKENIGYFYYSLNRDKFVDDRGKEIISVINKTFLINKSKYVQRIIKLEKNLLLLKQGLKNRTKPKKSKIKTSLIKKENINLGTKLILSKVYSLDKKENKIIKFFFSWN